MDFPWNRKGARQPTPKGFGIPIRPEDFVGHDPAANERAVRTGFVAKAKHYLGRLPIAEDVVALYFCLLDGKTPVWVKGVAAAALAYFVLPLDAIPDWLPVIGLGDDLSVLSAALAAVSTNLTADHRAKARAWLREEHIVAPGSERVGSR
jgi:uncharacterized membrane protein YkvA (DUF1232 family)